MITEQEPTKLDIEILVNMKELREKEFDLEKLRDHIQDLFVQRWHVQHVEIKIKVV